MPPNISLNPGERLDDLQINGLYMVQNTSGYCFTSDSVLLANFAKIKRGQKTCDLGCGSGLIPLLSAGKFGALATGVEIQEGAAALAGKNAELNGLSGVINIYNTPMQNIKGLLPAGAFDVVTCNPPYFKKDAGEISGNPAIAVAACEIAVTLREICGAAAYLLRFRGRFALTHTAERLAEVIYELKSAGFAVKEVQPVFASRKAVSPYLFLIGAAYKGADGLKILKPVYNEK